VEGRLPIRTEEIKDSLVTAVKRIAIKDMEVEIGVYTVWLHD
jgi:hypothetical protein